MWISAFLGMCTKFSEVTLAVHFRETNPTAIWPEVPCTISKMGLGKNGCGSPIFFPFSVSLLYSEPEMPLRSTPSQRLSGLPSQATASCLTLLSVPLIWLWASFWLPVALVLLGGIKRIGSVAEKLVPFMALLYILLSFGVVFFHLENVPGVFSSIIQGAFSPSAVTGGVVGSFFTSMKRGVSRGIFSNEAGLGTGSIAHACADTDNPVHQGMFGIFEVFADTIVICTLTALVILCSGIPITYGQDAGAELTILGFTSTYGNWVSILPRSPCAALPSPPF